MLTKTEWNNLRGQINQKFDKLEQKVELLEKQFQESQKPKSSTRTKKVDEDS